MKDRLFYPLFMLALAGIIAFALWPGLNNPEGRPRDIMTDGYLLSGSRLQSLTAAPGTFVSYIDGQDEKPLLAVLSSNNTRALAGPSAGVFGVLAPNYEKAFGGRKLEVTFTARSGRVDPLDGFSAGYFTIGAGDSPWHKFTLTKEFADYTFIFKPKPPQGKPGNDYVGIWPGEEGKNDTMELKSIRIKVVD
ncbi:MAG: hypothetical protein JKY25_09595 [Robiginitomaculum sp.]|nr:hypothetical protein [Robiginitomaculum sp.]